MPTKKEILIFSARSLPQSMIDKLKEAGFQYQEKDFIRVKHEFDEASFAARLNNPDTQARIFTSKNSVFSLQKLADSRDIKLLSDKKNFTVGIRATEMLEIDFDIKANARAGNAISLAQIIARNKDVKAVDFFCGNQSLDDLPEYLKSKGIEVNKEIVYYTQLVHETVDTADFSGVIFLSPTAVYSFFKKNRIDIEIPVFCIGATTSEAVHLRCDNKRIEANEPNLESVIDKVIEYYST